MYTKLFFCFLYLLTLPKCLNTLHTKYDVYGLETLVFLT